MVLIKSKILDFQTGQEPGKPVAVIVPQDCIFYKVVLLHDGIYAFFGSPVLEKDAVGGDTETFIIVKGGMEIPEDFLFVDILSSIVEIEDGEQAMILYPIFKKDSPRIVRAG